MLWGGARPMVRRQVCIQRTRNGGLGMPDLESHWLAERLAYLGRTLTGDAVWRLKASRTFPRPISDPKAEGRCRPLGETLFVHECRTALRNLLGSSDLSRPRKELYRELVVGSASDPLSERRGWTTEEIRSHWNWAPGSSFLNNSEFSLTWRLVRNALPLVGLNYKACLADMPDCARCGSGLEETVEHAFYYCERVRLFWDHISEWTARIEPKQLVLLDVGYIVDNVLPPFQGEKRVVFLTILAVARMVIWMTRNKGLYDDANFSHRDLVLYFRHQLRVKIRCDRKYLDRITFSKRWVHAASLVVRKGATLESSFPPLPDCFFSPWNLVSSMFVSHCPHHLAVSSQDLPHPHYFCTSTRIPVHVYWRSWTFICIKIISPACINPYRARPLFFFYPCRLGFLSHLG